MFWIWYINFLINQYTDRSVHIPCEECVSQLAWYINTIHKGPMWAIKCKVKSESDKIQFMYCITFRHWWFQGHVHETKIIPKLDWSPQYLRNVLWSERNESCMNFAVYLWFMNLDVILLERHLFYVFWSLRTRNHATSTKRNCQCGRLNKNHVDRREIKRKNVLMCSTLRYELWM